MAVRDDLATLRGTVSAYQDVISLPDVDRHMDAASRVEAELARLEEQAHGWRMVAEDADGKLFVKRAEAAESEVARLREGLRRIAETGDALSGVSPEADIARSLLDDNQEAGE